MNEENLFEAINSIDEKYISEAFDIVYSTASRQDTILLENDLPDAFNH